MYVYMFDKFCAPANKHMHTYFLFSSSTESFARLIKCFEFSVYGHFKMPRR